MSKDKTHRAIYSDKPRPPLNILDIIADGSLRAAALIAADKGIDPDPEALTRALRDQITEGWREAVNDAEEAREALSGAHARASLNLSCNLFALAALRQIGALPAKEISQ